MSEDTLYLLLCYFIFGITLAVLIFRSEHRRRTLAIHATIAILYNALLIYNLNTNSADGAGLVWLVFLMCALLSHSVVNLMRLAWTFKKRKQ